MTTPEGPARSSKTPPPASGAARAPAMSSAERTGRRVGRVMHLAAAATLSVIVVVELVVQVFFAAPHGAGPYAGCREGLRALYGAVQRARSEADQGVEASADEAALVRFREAVAGAWQNLDAVRDSCRGRGELESALGLFERLRYAEEHGVRSAAVELASLRRQARRVVDDILGGEGGGDGH